MIEDKVVGWHHRLNVHEFEQALGDGEGQGSLACCSPWGHKELDMPERPNHNHNNKMKVSRSEWRQIFTIWVISLHRGAGEPDFSS